MKAIFVTVSLFFTSFYLIAQPEGSQNSIIGLEAVTTEAFNLKGPVKTMTEEYTQRFNDGSHLDGNKATYQFDINGKLTGATRKIQFSGMDLGTYTDKYYYTNGRLTSVETWDNATPDKKEIKTYTYWASGALAYIQLTKEGRTEKTVFEVDPAKSRLSKKQLFHHGEATPYMIQQFTFDSLGRIIARLDEDVVKKTKEKHLFTYQAYDGFYRTQALAGGIPLYRGSTHVGGIGVSGDGIDQDDLIAASGANLFPPPIAIRSDNIFVRTVRLPFVKFPPRPFLDQP